MHIQSDPPFSFQHASLKTFWLQLCPDMTIEAEHVPQTYHLPLDWSLRLQRLRKEGYIQLDDVCSRQESQQLAKTVLTVQQQCCWPIFVLVYDAFWVMLQRVEHALSEILGGAVRVVPDCWVWHVEAKEEQTGWKPHRDRKGHTLDSDGTPQIISFWLALTDATPSNGCMYILPLHRDPQMRSVSEGIGLESIQDIRALPVSAGTALCWNHQVLHWGGRSSSFAHGPRISIAFECQRSSVPAFNTPLRTLDSLPSFTTRLGWIGRQILQYQHMISCSEELIVWAKKQAAMLPKERSFSTFLDSLLRRSSKPRKVRYD